MQIAGCCFQISSVPAVIMAVAMIKDGETVFGPSSHSLGQLMTDAIHFSNDMKTHT